MNKLLMNELLKSLEKLAHVYEVDKEIICKALEEIASDLALKMGKSSSSIL